MNPSGTIGSDPEFLLFDDEGFVEANEYCPSDVTVRVGCDGRDSTGELRPGFTKDPLTHALQVRDSLVELHGMVRHNSTLRVVGGSGYQGDLIGGHIHFGYPHSERIIDALDNYVAPVALLLADPDAWRNRQRGYGALGEYEEKPHGFEYRSLPSWIMSPGITQGILCLAHTVVKAAHYRELPALAIAESRSYKQIDKSFYLPKIGQVFQKIRKAPLYPKYFRQIAALKGLILAGKTWQEDRDVLARWGIRDTIPPIAKKQYLIAGPDHLIRRLAADHPDYNGPKILIYGMSSNRGGDVAYYSPNRPYVPSALAGMGLEVVRAVHGTAEEHSAPIRIGISRSLRDESPARAQEIVARVVEAAQGRR